MAGPYKGPITQHQEYAITGKVDFDQDFGVKKHNHKDGYRHNDGAHRKAALSDSARGIRKPTKFHPLPDHGPVE